MFALRSRKLQSAVADAASPSGLSSSGVPPSSGARGFASPVHGQMYSERPHDWLFKGVDDKDKIDVDWPPIVLRSYPRGVRKPRTTGIMEIRGPYPEPVGKRHFWDVLDVMGPDIDGVKFAAGSALVMQRQAVADLVDTAHENACYASSAGSLEFVLQKGPDAVSTYLKEARDIGFDVLELDTGRTVIMEPNEEMQLLEDIQKAGLQVRPKVHLQPQVRELGKPAFVPAARDTEQLITKVTEYLGAGVDKVVVDATDLMAAKAAWATHAANQLMADVGAERLMFDADDDAKAMEWLVKMYGDNVNISVGHNRALQALCLRLGISDIDEHVPPVFVSYFAPVKGTAGNLGNKGRTPQEQRQQQ